MAPDQFGPMMYAAIEAISEGKIAEAEIEFRHTTGLDNEVILTATFRNKVKTFSQEGTED